MARVREGDAVAVTSFARLVRSAAKLLSLSAELEARGVGLVSIGEGVDTSSPQGRYFLSAARAFHEVGRSIAREVQAEGVAAAKASGVAIGARRIDQGVIDRAVALHVEEGMPVAAAASAAGISASTLSNVLGGRR